MADKDWIQYRPHHNCREMSKFTDPDWGGDDLSCSEEDGDSEIPWNFSQDREHHEVEPYQWLYKDPVTGRITIFTERP